MSNIIELSARRAARALPPQNVAEVEMVPREMRRQLRWQQEPPQTETARNARLRDQRRVAWNAAEARTRYWSARMKLHSAIDSASRWGAFPKGALEEEHDHDGDGWMCLVRCFRSALAKQLLTPAWRSADVAWKRKALAAREHKYTDVTDEQIETAIQQDVEFLTAHPMRRNSAELEQRREFKAAMRQRIRDVAASRDLSDEELKPALTLKHHEIANFTEKHGVNLEWLLEGRGRIFQRDPIAPNMTGAELAAVVRTLPQAQQRNIEAMIDRILRERGL